MIDYQVIADLQNQGVRFSVIGNNIKVAGPAGVLTQEVLQVLREYKPLLLTLLDKDTWSERFNEIAAIRQHESELPQEEAEYLAVREVLWDYLSRQHPQILQHYLVIIGMEKMH